MRLAEDAAFPRGLPALAKICTCDLRPSRRRFIFITSGLVPVRPSALKIPWPSVSRGRSLFGRHNANDRDPHPPPPRGPPGEIWTWFGIHREERERERERERGGGDRALVPRYCGGVPHSPVPHSSPPPMDTTTTTTTTITPIGRRRPPVILRGGMYRVLAV